jgi:hypothetical protein
MRTVTRSELLEKLDQWVAGKVSAEDVHSWAAVLHVTGNTEFDDWEGNREFSAAKEALAELYMLDINLITKDDAPLFVRFLNTPRGQFEAGDIPFIGGLQQIDLDARKEALKDTEPYRRYCQSH